MLGKQAYQWRNNELCKQAVHSNWSNGVIQIWRFNYIVPVVVKLFNKEEQFYWSWTLFNIIFDK